MKKLTRLRLSELHQMSESEMKGVVGGQITRSTCSKNESNVCSGNCEPGYVWDSTQNRFISYERTCQSEVVGPLNDPLLLCICKVKGLGY